MKVAIITVTNFTPTDVDNYFSRYFADDEPEEYAERFKTFFQGEPVIIRNESTSKTSIQLLDGKILQ